MSANPWMSPTICIGASSSSSIGERETASSAAATSTAASRSDSDTSRAAASAAHRVARAAAEGIIDVARSTQVGLRTYNDSDHGFEILTSPWVHRHGIDAAMEIVRDRAGDAPVYVSFDIDGLDPAFAPGTGTPVAGGLSSNTVLQILRGLKGIDIVGMDIVEVAPSYDHAEVTALAAATLATELLYLQVERP